MTFKEIQELIKLIDKTELAEFRYDTDEISIAIKGKNYYKGKGGVAATPSIITPQMPQVMPASYTHVSEHLESKVSNDTPADNGPKPASDKKLKEIKSPMVGTFYRSSGPDKPPFVSVGDSIEKGTVICIIEAMKLFNEIESEFSGKIVKVMVEDAAPVEYDQVLYLVEE